MRAKVVILIFLILPLAPGVLRGEGKPSFSFGGLSLASDVTKLIDRYPTSKHAFFNFSPEYGHTKESLKQLLVSREDTYIVRLNEKESHDDIYYLQLRVEKGMIRRLLISFEKPLELMKPASHRQPSCRPILKKLVDTYGKHSSDSFGGEEGSDRHIRTWYIGTEQLSLHCYGGSGKGRVFATEIEIKPRSSGEHR